MLQGAEQTPYVAMSSGLNGYLSGSTWPSYRSIAEGDVLMIDTGSRLGGYFCDFNRNFAVAPVSDEVRRAQAALVAAAAAGIDAARPGTTMSELFRAQLALLDTLGMSSGPVGRFGHGLGKLMTEWPSIKSDDHVIAHPSPPYNYKVAGSDRPVRASRIAARGLRPWRRPVETMEQISA